MFEHLKEYVEKNDLLNKASKDFKSAFDCWKDENPDEFMAKFNNICVSDLNVCVETIGLRSSWPECTYNHVTVKASVRYNSKTLAYYTRWFPFGDDVSGDDFLEIW